jgi:O-antigen/teichoic acid export membrane protein
MKDLLKKLFGQSSTYALGRILTKGIGVILLPVYTRYLTPTEYGILAVASIIVSLLGPSLTGGSRGAALKFFYEYEGERRRRFYGSLLLTLIVGSGLLFLLVDAFGERIFGLVFAEIPYSPYIRMALWMAFLSSALVETTKQRLKANEQALAYTSINVGVFTLSTVLMIWWVVFQKEGAVGAVRGRLVGMAIMAVVCFGMILPHIRLSFNKSMMKRAFLYSLPLVPHYVSHWVLSSADRFLLERMMSLSDVGVYNVGYQLGMGMSLIASAGNNAVVPLFGNLDTTDGQDIKKVAKVFTYYMGVVLFLGLCIALFGEELIVIATPPEYHDAGNVVPWVVLGYVLMALYYSPTNLLTITEGRSHVVGVATATGAVMNIVLNIFFIPIIGIYGAAMTTTATYLVMFVGVYFIASRRYSVPFERRRLLLLFFAAVFTFGLGWSAAPDNVIGGILVKIGGLSAFPLVLWIVGFFREKEIRFVCHSMRGIRD